MNEDEVMQNPAKPIAYDADGNPLYAAPQPPRQPDPRWTNVNSHVTNAAERHDGHNFDPRARAQYANEPKVVHHPRAYEPEKLVVSEELRQKHEQSMKDHPNLNLSEAEYVILNIKRHPIGLWGPIAATIIAILLLLAFWISYPLIVQAGQVPLSTTEEVPGFVSVSIIVFSLIVLVGIFGYIAAWVYLRNTFYLTNESVIQEIQHGIFSRHEQTVSLGSIEDASFKQFGIWQTMFNYGTIRLSTEGEETTYRFQYVANPKAQIATLNNAIESFKNGRPVGD